MKTKPIIFIIITLIIGFVLGMLTSAQIRFNKLKPVRMYFSEDRFSEGFYKIIEPGEKQKAEIKKIIEKYAKQNSTLQSDFRKQLDINMKAFRKELDSKLTKEQLARLKELDDRRQEMIRQGPRGRRDSSDSRDFRRYDRDGRNFPDNGRMHPEGRPMPPPDSSLGTDHK